MIIPLIRIDRIDRSIVPLELFEGYGWNQEWYEIIANSSPGPDDRYQLGRLHNHELYYDLQKHSVGFRRLLDVRCWSASSECQGQSDPSRADCNRGGGYFRVPCLSTNNQQDLHVDPCAQQCGVQKLRLTIMAVVDSPRSAQPCGKTTGIASSWIE